MNVKGIIPALITPFDQNHEVNYDSIRALVNRLIDQGVDGFYVCGSTSEVFLLSDEERMKIVETVTEEVNGRVSVIVQVGSINVRKSVEYAKHAQSCGVDALSSMAPFYYKFTKNEIKTFYATISEATDLPLIYYHVPSLSGVAFKAADIAEMASACNIQGVKYTDYDLYELEKIKRQLPDMKFYYGRDEMYCSALPLKPTGGIGSTFNVMPQKFMAMQKAYDAGDLERAFQIQTEANMVLDAMLKCGGTRHCMKYLLTKEGIDCGSQRPPFAPLTEEQKAEMDKIRPLVFG